MFLVHFGYMDDDLGPTYAGSLHATQEDADAAVTALEKEEKERVEGGAEETEYTVEITPIEIGGSFSGEI